MTAVLAPEPEPLAALLVRLEPRLRRLANRYVRDPDASGDVVQRAFEKVLRHVGQFRQHAQPSTWVHRIVVNEALMWLRSERRRAARCVRAHDFACEEVRDPAPLPLEQVERAETSRHVRAALTRLRPADRELLERSVLEDVGSVALARSIGIHPATLKSRTYRARRKLAALLAEGA